MGEGDEKGSNILVYDIILFILFYLFPIVMGNPVGDINGDGEVNIADVVYLFKHFNEVPVDVGDLNCDNSVDIADCVYLFTHIQKWSQPVIFAQNFKLEPHWDKGYCYARDASGKWYVIVEEGYNPPSNIPDNAEVVYTGDSVKVNQRQFGESSFLGMVEWIKFYSAFRGEEAYEKANDYFQSVWKYSMSLRRKTCNVNYFPNVVIFCWDKKKDEPFVFDAMNFRVRWIEAVRGNYIFDDLEGTTGRYISKEEFDEKAADADVCILLDYNDDVKTKEDLLKLNPEFRYFKAYRDGRFYVSKGDILLANMYDAKKVMEDYARMIHPELFLGGDNDLHYFVNIIKSNKIEDNSNSNNYYSYADFFIKLVIGDDLYNFICGKQYNPVGLAIDIATLPILEGKGIVIGVKLGAKELIPFIVKSFIKDETKKIIEKNIEEKLISVGLKRETIDKLTKNGYDITKFYEEYKAVTDSDPILMEKLAKYINSWDLDRSNPLDESAGAQRLIKVFNAKGISTKVGYTEISDFAILKEGNNAWGWKHIIKRHETDFERVFNIKNDAEILEKIKETLKNPSIKPKYGFNSKIGKYEYRVYKRFGDNQYLLISLDNSGSITTVIPTTKYSKVETFMNSLD